MEIRRTIRIKNVLGLHARAAARLVEISDKYSAELYVKKGDHEVDGSSILTLLTLAGTMGSNLELRAVGDDADGLLNAVEELFEQRFGEEK